MSLIKALLSTPVHTALAGNGSESHAGKPNQVLAATAFCIVGAPLVPLNVSVGSTSWLAASVHGVLADGVEDPVHFRSPAAMVSVVHLLHEIVEGLLLRLVQGQGLPDVSDVVERLQLGHPRAQHHGKQVDEEVGVLPDCQVGLVAHLLKPGGRKGETHQPL